MSTVSYIYERSEYWVVCVYLQPIYYGTTGSGLLFQKNTKLISTVHLMSISAFSFLPRSRIQIDSPNIHLFSLCGVYNSSFSILFGSFYLPVSKYVAAIIVDMKGYTWKSIYIVDDDGDYMLGSLDMQCCCIYKIYLNDSLNNNLENILWKNSIYCHLFLSLLDFLFF